MEALIAAVVSPVAARRSLGRVGSYGLARIDRGLQLHRLTQAVLRDQLGADHTAAYRSYAEALLVAADPGDGRDPACWPGWARILPHLLATDPAISPSPDLRDLACRAAWYLYYRGDIHPARDLAEPAPAGDPPTQQCPADQPDFVTEPPGHMPASSFDAAQADAHVSDVGRPSSLLLSEANTGQQEKKGERHGTPASRSVLHAMGS